jgi:hypothetical protein
MEPYVEKHLEEIRITHDGQCMEAWVQKQHKISFTAWIKDLQDIPHGESDEVRLAFSHPPKSPCGKGMTSMDIGSTQRRRTRRA